eukprot:TRINITY_DN14582_c0_g2_i1.p2 TRINITY_DN14582_c0_g2~~TRINITY_DN14582_c0_g2_i1.p2  ORF type:complete len:163 (-),score=43.07 TRINITY_DN14582_c0_g2_i1:42-530(-)
MVDHREDDASAAATQKTDCDKEMAESKELRAALSSSEEKLNASISLEQEKTEAVEDTENERTPEDLTHDCTGKADNVESETESRAEELKAFAVAKQVLSEAIGVVVSATCDLFQASFLQVREVAPDSLAGSKVTRLVSDMARQHGSAALAQLASRIVFAMLG